MFTLTVNKRKLDNELHKDLDRRANMLIEELKRAVEEVDAVFTGRLKNSFVIRRTRPLERQIISTVPYAMFINDGGTLKDVDISDLYRWVVEKKRESEGEAIQSAFRIKEHLKTKGTHPRKYIEKAMHRFLSRELQTKWKVRYMLKRDVVREENLKGRSVI